MPASSPRSGRPSGLSGAMRLVMTASTCPAGARPAALPGGRRRRAQARDAAPEALEAVLRCRAITDEKEQARLLRPHGSDLRDGDERTAKWSWSTASRSATPSALCSASICRASSIFGGGDDDDGEEVNSIEGVVASAFRDAEGRWVITLQEGGTWRQINDTMLGRNPRAGSKVDDPEGVDGQLHDADRQPARRSGAARALTNLRH